LELELLWGGGDGVLAILREVPRLRPSRVVLTSAIAPAHVLDGLACPPAVQALTRPFQLSALFQRAALAAFVEQEQRPDRTRRQPAPTDHAPAGHPTPSPATGGSFCKVTPRDTKQPTLQARREATRLPVLGDLVAVTCVRPDSGGVSCLAHAGSSSAYWASRFRWTPAGSSSLPF